MMQMVAGMPGSAISGKAAALYEKKCSAPKVKV
jgi:hypothetical protein